MPGLLHRKWSALRSRIFADNIGLAVLGLAAVLFANPLNAQPPAPVFDATHLRPPLPLSMPWLVKDGDQAEFARANFDDRGWQRFDPSGLLAEAVGGRRPEVVWYRLHLKVDPAQANLALNELMISHAFEVYVNGEPVMVSGSLDPFIPYTLNARVLARIPPTAIASGSLVIALRVHISPSEWGIGQNPGYFADNLTIGDYEVLRRENWLAIIGNNSFVWLDHLLLIALGFVALVLFASQPNQKVYLWIFAVGALTLIELPEPAIAEFRNIGEYWEFIGYLPRLLSPYLWAALYFSFVHQRIDWRWRTFLIFAGCTNLFAAMQALFISNPLPFQALINLPFVVLLSVIVPIVLAVHWRRGNREAGILLIPVLLFSLYIYAEISLDTLFQFPANRQFALRGITLIDHSAVGPFTVSLSALSDILGSISLAIIMLLRSTTMSRRQAQLESELAAAQQVQQVLVPEQTGSVPGFTVNSVYQPAQQVGGDFFQVLPDREGGLLVVVGDVAGKGLPAAMLVSVLVGAIRGVAEYTSNPAELLANLNERLVGRGGGGFSTALVARIGADGHGTIANAGHLSPYLDGIELELPGALPLGVASAADYDSVAFYLEPKGRLTFYSDGVIEAQNERGELFGFERGREISSQPATQIVDAATRFGQQDDITVVTVERTSSETTLLTSPRAVATT